MTDIATEDFTNANIYDYALSWALLAAISLEQGDIDRAKQELKQLRASAPLFEQQKKAILIDLLEAKPRASSGGMRQLILTLNRYISLNPNFFGIGINLNKLVDDLEARKKQKAPTRQHSEV